MIICRVTYIVWLCTFRVAGSDQPSGFGFELTFRLFSDDCTNTSPPTWPAELLQSLARYVFQVRCLYQSPLLIKLFIF